MNNGSRLAILFAGLIVTGVFLNVYYLAAVWLLPPVLSLLGVTGNFQVYSPIYWVCLVAGAVTAFFVLRPAWKAVDKKVVRKSDAKLTDADHSS